MQAPSAIDQQSTLYSLSVSDPPATLLLEGSMIKLCHLLAYNLLGMGCLKHELQAS